MATTGKIAMVNGNMISVAFEGAVAQNEVGYAELPAGTAVVPVETAPCCLA